MPSPCAYSLVLPASLMSCMLLTGPHHDRALSAGPIHASAMLMQRLTPALLHTTVFAEGSGVGVRICYDGSHAEATAAWQLHRHA